MTLRTTFRYRCYVHGHKDFRLSNGGEYWRCPVTACTTKLDVGVIESLIEKKAREQNTGFGINKGHISSVPQFRDVETTPMPQGRATFFFSLRRC